MDKAEKADEPKGAGVSEEKDGSKGPVEPEAVDRSGDSDGAVEIEGVDKSEGAHLAE